MNLRRFEVKQADTADCGPACLVSIARACRLKLPITTVRRIVRTGRAGTTAADILQGAAQLGFAAKGVKGPPEALPSVPLPAIAHCLMDGRRPHYVVLVAWTPKFARVMDPAVGRVEKWTPAKFLAAWTGVLILLAPGEDFQPGDRTVPPWRRLWSILRPHRGVLAQAFCGAIVTTVLGLAMSLYVQKIVDAVIPEGNRPLLNLLGVGMLAVLGFKILLGVFQSLLSLRTAQKIDAALILAYYRHLLRLPQPFFDTMRVGDIASRVADAVKIRNFLNTSLLSLLLNPLVLLVSLGAIFLYSAKLAGLSLALVPCNAVIFGVADRINRVCSRRIMEHSADFEAQLVESLHAQAVIRHFRLEGQAGLKMETRLVRLLRTTWRAAVGSLGCSTAVTVVTSAYSMGLLWLGAGQVLDARLSPGELMSCYTLSSYLTGPMVALIGLNGAIQEALIATDRLFEIMDLELEADQGLIDFSPVHAGDIRFEHVTFRHAGRAATLQDVCLHLPGGKITAIVGESGCGKSTLIALLPRIHAPEQGRIFIGGHDVRYFRLASLRRNLAVVSQQTHLLSGTVLENLAPGDYQPDVARILEICRRTGVLGFIEQLPQGFLTHLGEDGLNLSGGQRQRLALARALYLDAPILLLDEPSSALDSQSEETLMRVLRELRGEGRTILLAAHHPRLVGIADHVVTLASGRVVSSGPAGPTSPAPAPL
jgi:ABC-type bacteriocin/lantibiotic exporter with double-glycine peptidase domain